MYLFTNHLPICSRNRNGKGISLTTSGLTMTNLTTASLTPVTDDLTTNDFIPTTYTINETEIEKDEGIPNFLIIHI